MTLLDDPLPARWARRAFTFAAYGLAALVAWTALPLLAVPLVLVDLIRRRPLPLLRTHSFLAVYLLAEVLGVAIAGGLWIARPFLGAERFLTANFRLQWAWGSALFGAARRVFSLGLVVEGDEAVGAGSSIVMVRHTSVADTLLPVVLLSAKHGLRLRYVLKRELLWDPCLDVVGQRLPNAFVRRGSDRSEREIELVRQLARDLGPNAGVLIYPEGTRFTPEKKVAALERLTASGRDRLVATARALEHVLPPRLGGPLALLDAAPEADVLIVGHVGFEGITTLAHLVRGTAVGTTVRVRFRRIPRAEVPGDADERAAWLFDEWARLDAWVGAQLSPSGGTRRGLRPS